MSTRLTGANHTVKIDGTAYTPQGTIVLNVSPRYANGRGGGDVAPVPIQIGLDDGANATFTLLSTDLTLFSKNGVAVACSVMNGSTTVETLAGILGMTYEADTAGMVTFNCDLQLTSVPSTLGSAISL